MATAGNTVNKIQKFSYTNANNTTVYNSDLTVKGNLTVVGSSVYAQTQVVVVKDNIITLNAAIGQSDTPLFNAGIEVDRGNQPNVALIWSESNQAWQFTTDGTTYESLGGGSAGVYANSAFLKANGAYAHANAAFVSANNVAPQVQPAFDKANAAFAFANTTTAWGTRQAFVATAGQTVFSPGSGYLAGYIDVYYNGIKLYGAEDYTATDGINVTLANPATVNSIIEIVGFGANVPVANIYVLNSMASLLNRQTFFATASQTTFTPTLSYRVGYVDVYYNGLKMNIPEDVTANNGTTVNFIGLTPTTNDVIEIVGLTPNVALANAIPITGGTISGGITLAGNVNPTSDNTYYLGSSTNRWHSVFVGPGSVDIGGLKLSNVSGVLSVSSPGAPATPIAGEDTWVRAQANAAFNTANNVGPQIAPAFTQANAAFIKANSAAQYGSNTTSNSSFSIPIGTTAERPASAANGAIRFNSTLGRIEGYMPSAGWLNILSDSYQVEYLVVAGGGGGGGTYSGGGGGAGGLLTATGFTVTPNEAYTVTIGAGGATSTASTQGNDGTNSVFSSLTAIGGGGGACSSGSGIGRAGGSGGGAEKGGVPGGTPFPAAGAGTAGQGYPGGLGYDAVQNCTAGGGGGGAGGPGSDSPRVASNQNNAGPGGIGLELSISGAAIYYAGGGGGGNDQGNTSAAGGAGGGGSGYMRGSGGTAGTANRGGGGGGAGNGPQGAAGGSGIVIIRYLGAQRGSGGTITSGGGYTVHTFTGSGTYTA
jgi:hypothetical protein